MRSSTLLPVISTILFIEIINVCSLGVTNPVNSRLIGQQNYFGKSQSSSSITSSRHPRESRFYSASSDAVADTDLEERELILASIPSNFTSLFTSTIEATVLKAQDNTKGAHDAFRYEWGTWIDEEAIANLMQRVDEIRVAPGAHEKLLEFSSISGDRKPRRFKIAGDDRWDCILHVLPSDIQYEGRWPTGSWAILKSLTGVAEISMLREDRDGNLIKRGTKKDLRGGSDGSFGVGGGASTSGDDCIKYVGGPLRSYMGKSQRTILFELVVRPPSVIVDLDKDDETDNWPQERMDEVMEIYIPEPEPDTEEETLEEKNEEEEKHESAQQQAQNLGSKLGMNFELVGGLDSQLDTIVRRVLASRANPEAARRLGISHVRGILLSGPPGCGKTLLARELARLLGAREPQIVNGPEILDKFIGEAEKRVRQLFVPAEMEYAQVGDESALHIIILDEMDAIARKRGSSAGDNTGVRDSVVNQLLSKMDGVKQANNVLVVGLTNRPELLDPALLRPGRLEVQLRVELPDLKGRRDILRIHTRQMKEAGGLSKAAEDLLEDLGDKGLPSSSDKFTGAELAGLVRSAASYALARSVNVMSSENDDLESILDSDEGKISVADFEQALLEVRPSLGKQDELLQMRYPMGISRYSSSMERIMRDLKRFITPAQAIMQSPRLNSLLLVGSGGNGGAGVTALAAWAAAEASSAGLSDYVRFITALDLLTGEGSGGEGSRAAALVDRFSEAKEMPNSLLVLDDIDQLCAGSGPGGYSSVMIATLRALLRTPPERATVAKAGGQSMSKLKSGRSMHIIATTSRSDAACVTLHELFEETIVVPLLSDPVAVEKLLAESGIGDDTKAMGEMIISRMEGNIVSCKTALRLGERAVAAASFDDGSSSVDSTSAQLEALERILDDFQGDEAIASKLCEVIL